MQKIIDVYVFLFARPIFLKLNKLLYRLSLSGLGILNYKTSKISGEKYFIEKFMPNKKWCCDRCWCKHRQLHYRFVEDK